MNPEDPKDIKCPQCAHRMPLDVDIDQLKEVICDQCKTVFESQMDAYDHANNYQHWSFNEI